MTDHNVSYVTSPLAGDDGGAIRDIRGPVASDRSHVCDLDLTARQKALVVMYRDLWLRGRLDQRCLDCGTGSAAGTWCYRCGSTHLEYVPRIGVPPRGPIRRPGAAKRVAAVPGAVA